VKGTRRIWIRRAGLLAAAGILLAGNLGFFLWYRGTARDRKVALEERRAALEREVQARELDARKLSTDQARLSEVRSAIDRFYGHSVGRREETLAGIVDELHAILKRVGVSPGEISYSVSAVTNPPVSQMVVSFGFKGDYGKFKRLLEVIQTGRKWIAVRDIALNRDQDTPGSVHGHLSLVTYFSAKEIEATRASLTRGSVP
jgi:hypothetical protein